MNSAHELFVDELHDMYGAEKRLLEVLSESEEQSQRSDLKKAFARHRKQTEGHVKRLDRVFKSIGEQPQEKECEGLEGLVKEKQTFQEENPSPELLDLFSIGAALKVERYEISAYESLINLAQHMKHRDAVALLKENLKEEQETAKLMLTLAKDSDIDWEAGMGVEEEEGEGVEEMRPARGARRTRRVA